MRAGSATRAAARLLAVVVAAVALLVTLAPQASAHATLESTSPGAGTVSATQPRDVQVGFDESVGVSTDALRVYGPSGRRVDTGGAAHAGATAVRVALRSGLPAGTYTVAWHVVSADSHPVSGAFTFSIGHPSAHVATSAVQSSTNTLVAWVYGVVRGLAFLAFAVLLGGLAFWSMCWPAGAADPRAGKLVWVAWCVSAAAAVLAFCLQGVYAAGMGLARLVDPHLLDQTAHTRFGLAVLVRLALLAVVGAFVTSEQRPSRRWLPVWLLLAVLLAGTWAASDHSSVGRQPLLAMGADIVHLVAMACWVGGLAMLLVALRAGLDPPLSSSAARVFSTAAGWCVLLMILTGTYQSWRNVGHWAAMVDTTYGRLLLVKILGVTVLALLGLNARRIIGHLPRARRRPETFDHRVLRRSVLLEAGVVVVVLAATAALVNTPTGREAYHPVLTTTRSFDTGAGTAAGRGTVAIRVSPALLGPQTITVTVRDRQGRAEEPAELSASMSLPARDLGPLPLTLRASGGGRYRSTPTPIFVAGAWQVSVTVRSDDFDEATVVVPVQIG